MNTNLALLDAEDQLEFDQLEAEFEELRADFGELGFVEEPGGSLDVLDAELLGSGLEDELTEQSGEGEITLLDIADGRLDQMLDAQGFNPFKKIKNVFGKVTGFFRRKAAKLIKKLIKYVRKYSKLASCAPKVAAAVAAFKAGKYGTAITTGYSALKCIKSKL